MQAPRIGPSGSRSYRSRRGGGTLGTCPQPASAGTWGPPSQRPRVCKFNLLRGREGEAERVPAKI